jgi:hypothetical protein
MKLYPYQEYFINQLDKHNIIVTNWYTGAGVDTAIDHYIQDKQYVGYCGYKSVLATIYTNNLFIKNISLCDLDKLRSNKIDILIIDYINKNISDVIDYCVSHNIKVIIKLNNLDLKLNCDYYYSDGSMTIEKDRERKLKRIKHGRRKNIIEN